MTSLKVATMLWVLRDTPLLPLAGVVAVTVGAVRSGAAEVVKFQLKGCANASPSLSRISRVSMAKHNVSAGRFALVGRVSVAVWVLAV